MDDFFSDYDGTQPLENTKPSGQAQGRRGSYAEEIFSRKIEARSRTYYIDVKQSQYGKFIKVSEKSNGRKNTIMVDAENVVEFMEALQEAQKEVE